MTIACLVVLLSWIAVPCFAMDYTVGDADGWRLDVDYNAWASGKDFKVGDKIVFHYGPDHNIYEVGFTNYHRFTINSAISYNSSGSTTIQLKTPGTHCFMCGITSHCSGGMKLAITVNASATTVTPSGNPLPPGPGTLPYGLGATTTPGTATIYPIRSGTHMRYSSAGTPSPIWAATLLTWGALQFQVGQN